MSNDRFSSPKPKFFSPSKALIPTDGSFRSEKGALPSQPLNRAPLPALSLPTFSTKRGKTPNVKVSVPKNEKAPIVSSPMIKWGPEDVVSDEEFIIRTRGLSIHDDVAKRLFMANGGEAMVEFYTTIANAFDALRRYKVAKLSGQLDGITQDTPGYSRVSRFASHEINIYVPGCVDGAREIRERGKESARIRSAQEAWIYSDINNRKAG